MEELGTHALFGEWLKRRRKALDMTQDELARRVGCSVGALRKIESGDRRPSKQLAALLAEGLEISTDDQQSFIRTARGELSFEHLPQLSIGSIAPVSLSQTFEQAPYGTSFPKEFAIASPASHIPLLSTPLIGRESELTALERLFNDPQCRLLTLTGIGGIGKTSLAIDFASRNNTRFPGGIFFIPLVSIISPEKIVPAIADVLNFGFSGQMDPKEQLIRYIADKILPESLFIFDNLEHLLIEMPTRDGESGAAALVSEFLMRLPGVKVLATSRENLGLHGEWTYELHGLSVPIMDILGKMEDYASIALFLNCAQRTSAKFQATPDEQFSILRICQLVDGVPLAIELAAAWVGVLTCQEIALEIQSNLDFLTGSMRDVPERHRSIKATFDHSWKLLSADERLVLSQLSVFHGGFDRSAAQEIAGATLPLLASLSAKSLLRRTESGRFDIHEVIRQYAFFHLNDEPQGHLTCQRHSKYYLEYTHSHESSLKSGLQQDAMRQLSKEIDNIRAAWIWAIEHRKFVLLGLAGRAFGWYYEVAGLYREGIEQLELLIRELDTGSNASQWDRVLGLALVHQALLYFRTGEFDKARKLYEDSLTVLRPTGDQHLLADALIFLGIILHLSGDYARAESLVKEGLVLARQNRDRWFEAYAICNLGYIASLRGRYAEGYEQMLAALEIWRKLGDPHYIALGLNFSVPTLIKLGMYERAEIFMHESISLCEQAKNRWGMGTAYRYLGLVKIAEGQYADARVNLFKSLEIFGQDFIGWDIARTLTYLGDAARLSGDTERAKDTYADALRSSAEVHAVPVTLDALAGMGQLHARSGSSVFALLLAYFILDHPSSEADTKTRAEELIASLETKLSPSLIETVRAKAKAEKLERIVKEALETEPI